MDEIILKLVEEGLSAHKIAKEIGMSQTWVSRYLRKIGVKTKIKSGPPKILSNPNAYCKKCGLVKEKRNNYYCNSCSPGKGGTIKLNDIKENTTIGVVKRIIIERRGHQCENCKFTMWMGLQVPLQLHHIDGDSDNNDEKK